MRLNITRVQRIPPANAFVVMVSAARRNPSILDFREPGLMSAMITHDPGMDWPDRRGVLLMKAVLAEQGTVALIFESTDDASACREHLIAGDRT